MGSRAGWFHSVVRGERQGFGPWATRALLWWIRWPYGAVVCVRNGLFNRGWKKSTAVDVPVVCIGNITLGGTGKTPMVEYVASYYRERELSVAIVSRGYGADAGPNDEAMLLEENLPDVPHLQGADRLAMARTAIEELECELIVLDDGFQHRRLKRNFDIVLLDATHPIQDEYLFPRGTLREPVSALRRASVVVLTRADQVDESSRERQLKYLKKYTDRVAVAVHDVTELIGGENPEPVESLRNANVAAFCGIGNPESFQKTLKSLGASVVAFRSFADHHNYTREDIDGLRQWATEQPEGTLILTTQKDWVKIRLNELGGRSLRALRVGMKIVEGEEVLHQVLESCLLARSASEGLEENEL